MAAHPYHYQLPQENQKLLQIMAVHLRKRRLAYNLALTLIFEEDTNILLI